MKWLKAIFPMYNIRIFIFFHASHNLETVPTSFWRIGTTAKLMSYPHQQLTINLHDVFTIHHLLLHPDRARWPSYNNED